MWSLSPFVSLVERNFPSEISVMLIIIHSTELLITDAAIWNLNMYVGIICNTTYIPHMYVDV